MGNGHQDHGCFDLSNIEILDTIGSEQHPLAMSHNLIFKDDFLYISHFVDGLYIYDLSNLDSIRLAGYYDTSTRPHEQGKWEGAWGVYPFLPSGNVLISDMQTGLWVLDVHDAITGVKKPSYYESYSVYPNPTQGELFIHGKGLERVSVYDLYGSLVMIGNSQRLDVSNLSDGIYLLKTMDEKGAIRVSKVVKN